MAGWTWNPADEDGKFDLGDSGARPGQFLGTRALYMEKPGAAIWLREEIPFSSYRVEAEVAIPESVGFVGIAFGAKDEANYELIYLAPVEIQYDPVMNGSMTWQIYNGSRYQKPLPDTTGSWTKLIVDVHPEVAVVYLGDDPAPQLIVSNLQHKGEGRRGAIGLWNFLPAYVGRISVTEIEPIALEAHRPNLRELAEEGFVTEWLVSEPYPQNAEAGQASGWNAVEVEENGTLNLNRPYTSHPGLAVTAEAAVNVAEEGEFPIHFGFSDRLKLWINGEPVYEGSWRWQPPGSDGRITADLVTLPIRWRAGENRIRAELTCDETFGWGLCAAIRTNR
jgi:hypothetical protein